MEKTGSTPLSRPDQNQWDPKTPTLSQIALIADSPRLMPKPPSLKGRFTGFNTSDLTSDLSPSSQPSKTRQKAPIYPGCSGRFFLQSPWSEIAAEPGFTLVLMLSKPPPGSRGKNQGQQPAQGAAGARFSQHQPSESSADASTQRPPSSPADKHKSLPRQKPLLPNKDDGFRGKSRPQGHRCKAKMLSHRTTGACAKPPITRKR